MSQQHQPLRGTRDIFGEDCRRLRFVEQTAARICGIHGFQEIETPIMEPASLFKRTLGDTSDIVSKQMYLFKDQGGDEIVLRPEGTAGVARAFISEGLAQHTPLKLFYRGPMFRYERPQKGRYRQFSQVGVEILGVEKPQADIDVIMVGYQILQKLNVTGSITLLINTLGDQESREAYRDKLVKYLKSHEASLSADSRVRLEKNPLRILDSKDENDRKIIQGAPRLADSLTPSAAQFFEQVLSMLKDLQIPFTIDDKLVRGLDYYTHTVFEFVTDALGSQNAVLAGGRYDRLISDMGGPMTPGVGWGMGIERLSLMLQNPPAAPASVSLVPLGEEADKMAITLAQELRYQDIPTDLGYGGNLAKRMKRADKIGSRCAVIFGSNEIQANQYQVKDLKTGTQSSVPKNDLINHLRSLL